MDLLIFGSRDIYEDQKNSIAAMASSRRIRKQERNPESRKRDDESFINVFQEYSRKAVLKIL
ncbi:MAG: hypothetical protein SOV71_06935 [Anaerovoracaceae bacterium]|nr:hypothetical protein [Bacillota bacterium]MDY2671272.1 hypothetical protein [Anaerovoracaceae bacterium]